MEVMVPYSRGEWFTSPNLSCLYPPSVLLGTTLFIPLSLSMSLILCIMNKAPYLRRYHPHPSTHYRSSSSHSQSRLSCSTVLLAETLKVRPSVAISSVGSDRSRFIAVMMDDQDLGFFATFLGIFIFILVIAYHFVMAEPKYE
ncbi:hypothetical protein SAY87_026812 [Trapa incisa]|uniref:Dolichyl-diphosphooligosaccharide--protein glycosyltransferase subunit 4A n=1 Tax=Trapa incisa TaxID=236973 RepID=A0AAN7JME5_9MYRT|nr:hypothetical protein SAY87_026812 [Trapa incisa]